MASYVGKLLYDYGPELDEDREDPSDSDNNGVYPSHIVVTIDNEDQFLEQWGLARAFEHSFRTNRLIAPDKITFSLFPNVRVIVFDAGYLERFFVDYLAPWLGEQRATRFVDQVEPSWWRLLPEHDTINPSDEDWDSLSFQYDQECTIVLPDPRFRVIHRGGWWGSPQLVGDRRGVLDRNGNLRGVEHE